MKDTEETKVDIPSIIEQVNIDLREAVTVPQPLLSADVQLESNITAVSKIREQMASLDVKKTWATANPATEAELFNGYLKQLTYNQLLEFENEVIDKGYIPAFAPLFLVALELDLITTSGHPLDESVLPAIRAEILRIEDVVVKELSSKLESFSVSEKMMVKHYLRHDGFVDPQYSLHPKCLKLGLITEDGKAVSELLLPTLVSLIVKEHNSVPVNPKEMPYIYVHAKYRIGIPPYIQVVLRNCLNAYVRFYKKEPTLCRVIAIYANPDYIKVIAAPVDDRDTLVELNCEYDETLKQYTLFCNNYYTLSVKGLPILEQLNTRTGYTCSQPALDPDLQYLAGPLDGYSTATCIA